MPRRTRRTRTVLVVGQPSTIIPDMVNGEHASEVDDVTIPCECCDEPVWFSSYTEHLRACAAHNTAFSTTNQQHIDRSSSSALHLQLHAMRRLYETEEEGDGSEQQASGYGDDEEDIEEREDASMSTMTNLFETITLRFNNPQGMTRGMILNHPPQQDFLPDSVEGRLTRDQALQTLTELIMNTFTSGDTADDYENNTLLSNMMGGAHLIGVTSIDAVTSVSVDTVDEMCPVCQDTITGEVRKTLCGHVFCGECISKWLLTSKKCPVCMIALED